MEAGQVHSWLGNQGSEPGHESKRLKDDVYRAMPKALVALAGRAFPVRCFQLVANITIGRQPQPLLGYLRAAEVPAQAFQFLAVIGPRRDPGMQIEPSYHADLLIERRIAGRQRLQRKHLAALLWTYRDAIHNRRTQRLFRRTGLKAVACQVAVFGNSSRRCSTSCIPAVVGIPFQLSLAFQVVADGQRQDLGQSGELGA